MNDLRDAFNEIVTDVPVYGDIDRAIDRAIAQADQERRRRNGVVAALAAAAAVVAAIAGGLAIDGDRDGSTPPIDPVTPTESTTIDTLKPMANGRIGSVNDHYPGAIPTCERCSRPTETAFDPATRRLLLAWPDPDDQADEWTGHVVRVDVVGRGGKLAELTCPEDFACRRDASTWMAILGPSAGEVSLEVANKKLEVVGYDGTVRRTLDLSGAFDDEETVVELVWSPDGSRLAVVSRELVTTSGDQRSLVQYVRIFDREGEGPQLVYTAANPGPVDLGRTALAYIWNLAWSPDGSRLGFMEEYAQIGAFEDALSRRVISLVLPAPGEDAQGTPTTLYETPKAPGEKGVQAFDLGEPSTFLWSPDGERVVVRDLDEVLELSADDGRVLVDHELIRGPLIWPAKR